MCGKSNKCEAILSIYLISFQNKWKTTATAALGDMVTAIFFPSFQDRRPELFSLVTAAPPAPGVGAGTEQAPSRDELVHSPRGGKHCLISEGWLPGAHPLTAQGPQASASVPPLALVTYCRKKSKMAQIQLNLRQFLMQEREDASHIPKL